MINSFELFSGAGGLAKGIELAGANHVGFVEWDKDACNTLRTNYKKDIIHEVDIREFDFSTLNNVDIIAGGPPCQPFSLGGKHKGNEDNRDMFPYAINGIRSLRPKAFIFENVKGLLRKTFSSYFNYIILQLTYPELTQKKNQEWYDHLSELEKIHTKGDFKGLKYNIVYRLINAADYGIPQKRERVVIVGIRSDINKSWSFPEYTHSEDSLNWDKYVTNKYFDLHKIKLSKEEKLRGEKIRQQLVNKYGFFEPNKNSWVTIRDVLSDLPEPTKRGEFHKEHTLRTGARVYPGHTGSDIDEPAKTIKAGGHGVPGGENMIRFRNGSVRYFTTFEAKRIQTFPDNYLITGSWTEAMRQIGNAVPVRLGEVISNSIFSNVFTGQSRVN